MKITRYLKRIYASAYVRALFGACLCSLPSFSAGEPWVTTGDERTRHHLLVLSDSGKLTLPLTTWPIMWSGIKQGLDHIRIEDLNDAELWSYRYLRHHLERAIRKNSAMIRVKGSNLPVEALNGFAADTREGAEASVSLNVSGENYALKVNGSYVNDPATGHRYRLDGSYFAYTYANWVAGIGKIDRWWGPGWQGSTILGHSARPMPSVFIHRKNTAGKRINHLGWLGNWDVNLFFGQLNDDRAFVEKPSLMGARFIFKPFHFAEFGLSSTQQSGGNLIADDPETPDEEQQSANNRMKGFDWRIGKSLHNFQLGLYQQYTERDSSNLTTTDSASIVGLEMGLTWWGVNTRLSLEKQDTTNNGSSIFDDPHFKNGYRYYQHSLATSIDSAANSLTLQLDHYFDTGQQLSWRLGKASLNDDNIALEAPAGPIYGPDAIDIDFASIVYKTPLSNITQLEAGVRYFGESLTFADQTIETGGYLQLTFAL